MHAVRTMTTVANWVRSSTLAALVAAHGMIRIGVAPEHGRKWCVVASTMRNTYLATLERGIATKAEAGDRAVELRHRAAAMAPTKPPAPPALEAPAPVDREAAIRLAIGILRDLERVIPSPRIAEALALLSH